VALLGNEGSRSGCQRTSLGGHSGGVRGRLQSRDRARVARFERMFAEHSRSVFAYAARRAPERADDVVAETFAVAWRRFDDLPRDVEPWLFGVARRVLAGQWRSQSRQSALVSRLIEIDARQAPEGEADYADIYGVLGQLSESDREVLMLTYWEGLAPERAAVVLGISRDAVNQRVHRARERLRALCQEAKATS
jgi:RNA polymerase sigma factor (sigma-70 family)